MIAGNSEYFALAAISVVMIALASRAMLRLRPLSLWERVVAEGNRVRGFTTSDDSPNTNHPTNSKVPSPLPSPRGRGGQTAGTATMEFVLVFPILLFFSLLLAQTTLLAGANAFIHYAAFAATRSAIVQIPTGYAPDESPNVIINADGHTKHDAIRRAAVFALLPVSGRLSPGSSGSSSSSSTSPEDFATALANYYTAYNKTPPAWINNTAADRLRYADANTMISVMSTTTTSDNRVIFTDLPSDGSSYTFGPRDPVTVRVTHRLHLAIPYVNALFSDGVLDGSQGTGRYALVTAQSTLTNEGVYDDLPPTPDVPRVP